MNSAKETIAQNIQMLRKANNMTQLDFAKKLDYSDKAVSRWEKAEATPDVDTLKKIAELFSITISELFEEGLESEKISKATKKQVYSRTVISLLLISLVWIAAGIIYAYIGIANNFYYWKIFVYAVPVSAAIGLVFNVLWGEKLWRYIIASIFIWTLITAIFITFLEHNLWPLFILCVPIQTAIILWHKLKK